MGRKLRTILAAAAASASLAAHAIASSWTIVDLGTIGGPGLSSPQGLSDNGLVVGCATVAGDSGTRAFVYSNGVMRDLAPEAPANSLSCALAVNNAGLIGGRIDGEITIWNNGTTTRLGVQGGVAAINEAGIVVGTITDGPYNQPGPTHAFMWTNGNLIMLPMDTALTVNERNEILGTASGSPVIYSNGTLTRLPLPNAKWMNDSEVVVGGMNFSPGEPSPFVYDGTAREIPGAPCCGFAIAINNSLQIVGSSEGVHGFLSEGGQTTLLDRLGGVSAAGWGHLEPRAMNERGWIIGTGNSPSGFGGFLLMPNVSSVPASNANPEARDMTRTHALLRARYP